MYSYNHGTRRKTTHFYGVSIQMISMKSPYSSNEHSQKNIRRWPNVALLLSHRLRHLPRIYDFTRYKALIKCPHYFIVRLEEDIIKLVLDGGMLEYSYTVVFN